MCDHIYVHYVYYIIIVKVFFFFFMFNFVTVFYVCAARYENKFISVNK